MQQPRCARYPICCAVPYYNHPLAERNGCASTICSMKTLMLCEPGWIADVDALREEVDSKPSARPNSGISPGLI